MAETFNTDCLVPYSYAWTATFKRDHPMIEVKVGLNTRLELIKQRGILEPLSPRIVIDTELGEEN